MKNIMKIALLVLTLSLLASCTPAQSGGGNGGDEVGQQFTLKAKVNAVGEKIEVDVIEGEYASGIYWVIASDETEIIGKSGSKLAKDDINVGDTLEIVYNGQVMMSYPPQIVARKITVL